MKPWLFLSFVLHLGVLTILLLLPLNKTAELESDVCVTCDDSIIHTNDFMEKMIPEECDIDEFSSSVSRPISLLI